MRRFVVALLVLVCTACGGDKTPTAPTPPAIAQVAGNWSGTFESTNFGQTGVTVQLSQTSGTVSGTYAIQSLNASGNITGTIDSASFTGQVTLTAPATNGSNCVGGAALSGPASGAPTTLRWTSPGFATGNCNGMPIGVAFVLQRR